MHTYKYVGYNETVHYVT